MIKKLKEEVENLIINNCKQWLKDNWQKPFGFIILTLVIAFVIIIPIHIYISKYFFFLIFIDKYYFFAGVYSVLYFIIFIIVFQVIKYPITKKNKIGIYIAISNRFEDQEAISFIKKIHKEIEAVLLNIGFGNIFNVVLLDEYKSQKIIKNPKFFCVSGIKKSAWSINLDKARWHFILFGSLKCAKAGIEKNYKIEPDYAVSHKPISGQESDHHGKDFKSFLVTQKWEFPSSQEMSALEVISGNVKENIMYALGVSAYVSGLIDIAKIYHEALYAMIQVRILHESYLGSLNKRLKKYLTQENHILGNYFLKKKNIDLAISYQEKSLVYNPNFYYAHLNLAHHYYLKGSGYESKTDYHLEQAEKYTVDASYKLSKACILIERENKLKEGADLYIETLRSGSIPSSIVQGTLVFIDDQIKDPLKQYFIFIKGLVYYFKVDQNKSKIFFEKFINDFKDKIEYEYWLQKSEKYLEN